MNRGLSTYTFLIESLPLRDTKICMDSTIIFTWSRVLKGAHDMNVAIVGTARAKRGWPPKRSSALKMTDSILCIGKITRTTTPS